MNIRKGKKFIKNEKIGPYKEDHLFNTLRGCEVKVKKVDPQFVMIKVVSIENGTDLENIFAPQKGAERQIPVQLFTADYFSEI